MFPFLINHHSRLPYLLLCHTNYAIDSTKTWLIHYQDTLPNPKIVSKNSKIRYLNANHISNKRIKNLKDYHKIIPKQKSAYSKCEDLALLYFYDVQNDYPIKTKSYQWHQDKGLLIKKLFNDGMKAYKTIIIHPNGDFYMTATRKTKNELKNILVVKKYKKTKKKTIKKFDKLNSKKP